MTDRELLEKAAKVVGLHVVGWTGVDLVVSKDATGDYSCGWNPLTDDGEALRLAVRLNMRVSVGQVDWLGGEFVGVFSEIDAIERDPYAATRRAIVLATVASSTFPEK